MIVTFLPIMVACVLFPMSTLSLSSQVINSSDDEPIENYTYSKSQLSLAQIGEYLKIDDVYKPGDVAISKINYQHHHEISKRDTISSPKMGSNHRNSPVCEGRPKLVCIYFYPDHPDAGRSSRIKGNHSQAITNNGIITIEKQTAGSNQIVSPICEDTSSFCTYFYPDHPNAGLGRTNKNFNNSNDINIIIANIGIIKQNKTKSSNKTYLPSCEDTSSFCTFRKKNNNYTAVIANVAGTSITDHKYLLDTICSNQSLDVRLRNSNTKEFLYAAADYLALDEEKRPVFTWKDLKDIPGISDEFGQEETWRIEPFDQVPSKSFLLRNLKVEFGPKAYMFAGNSDKFVYVRRGLSDNENPVSVIGLSAKWRLLAKLVDQTKLQEDICDIDTRKIQGWVLMNVKSAPKCIIGDENDLSKVDNSKKRGNVRIAPEVPYSYWEVLPLSTYQPSSIPITPPRNWKEGRKGTKWDINCDFFGNNIADSISNLSDLECIDRCISNSDCTHWTYTIRYRNCWLKQANEMKENYFFMAKCGFVTGRSEQKY